MKKEYLGCIIPVLLLVGLVVYLFAVNGKEEEPTRAQAVGKYLYIDTEGTLHVHRSCVAVGRQVVEQGSADRAVMRVPAGEVTEEMLKYSCSRCINDELYEQLAKMATKKEK
jgi:hypothetical protein